MRPTHTFKWKGQQIRLKPLPPHAFSSPAPSTSTTTNIFTMQKPEESKEGVKKALITKQAAELKCIKQADLSDNPTVNQKEMIENLIPTVEKKWLQNNIFDSTSRVNGQEWTVVIDGGSFNSIVSQALMDHIKLIVCKHHQPHLVRWLKKDDEVDV